MKTAKLITKLLLPVLLLVSACQTDDGLRQVVAENGLRMRSQPSLEAERILTVPDGVRVKLLETSPVPATIEGQAGHWVKVEYNKKAGWVFDAYLQKWEPTDESELMATIGDTKVYTTDFDHWYQGFFENVMLMHVNAEKPSPVSEWACMNLNMGELQANTTWDRYQGVLEAREFLKSKGESVPDIRDYRALMEDTKSRIQNYIEKEAQKRGVLSDEKISKKCNELKADQAYAVMLKEPGKCEELAKRIVLTKFTPEVFGDLKVKAKLNSGFPFRDWLESYSREMYLKKRYKCSK